MAYPTDKEEFRRVVNQDLPDVPGDIVDKDDQNLPADFLERLQDTLGYNIKMGYVSVKAFFDYVVSQVSLIAGKANKAGDTFTGDVSLDYGSPSSPVIYFGTIYSPTVCMIRASGGSIRMETKTSFKFYKGSSTQLLEMTADVATFYNTNGIRIIGGNGEVKITEQGKGVIVKTPDNTKSYRISVDNAGNVISTLV